MNKKDRYITEFVVLVILLIALIVFSVLNFPPLLFTSRSKRENSYAYIYADIMSIDASIISLYCVFIYSLNVFLDNKTKFNKYYFIITWILASFETTFLICYFFLVGTVFNEYYYVGFHLELICYNIVYLLLSRALIKYLESKNKNK